jgi:hypothetical protein
MLLFASADAREKQPREEELVAADESQEGLGGVRKKERRKKLNGTPGCVMPYYRTVYP